MKKILFFCIFITGVMNINAQSNWCGTTMDSSLEAGSSFSDIDQNVSMDSFLGLEPYVLKVHFWDVNENDGGNTSALTLDQMLNTVATLNKDYNAFNIFFKYDGSSSFNAGQFQDINMDVNLHDFKNYQNDYDLFFAGTINIYSVKDITNNDEQDVAAYYKSGPNAKFGTIVSRDYIIGNGMFHITHELGHFFRLDHTFKCRADPSNEGEELCENVTRDPNDPDGNYNADTEGDEIIDTYATPTYYIEDNCIYNDTLEDSTGTPYLNHPPQAKNFMSYMNPCQEEFTPGQVSVMRYYINYYNNHEYIRVIKKYPVSILYEPYLGDYAPYYPHPNPWTHPLFQPGFDYEFVECGGEGEYPQPADYSDTSYYYDNNNILLQIDKDETDFSNIVHPNHAAIRILQLTDPKPRKCYDNYNSPDIIGGIVVKFNDNVFNNNVTITAKDSTSINDEELIDDLQPGLYNVIKNYENGDAQETVIYKEDN